MTDPFRICLIAPTAYSLFNPLVRTPASDADIYIYELSRRLGSDSRFDVSVIVGEYDQDEVEYYGGALVYRMASREIGGWLKRRLRRASPFERQLSDIDPQAVMMTGASATVLDAARACRKQKRPFAYFAALPRDCDGSFAHSGEEGERFRQGLRMADAAACLTREQSRMLQRTEKIKPYVMAPLIAPAAPPEQREFEAVWVGELEPWKQPEYFFRLAATLPNQSFTLYGTPRKTEYLESLVEKTRNLPNLAFQNSVPFAEIGRFIARARLLVNTSRYEGFPYAIAMALAAGVPVASLNVDPDGIIEANQLGVFSRGSEIHLAQEIASIMQYPRHWKRFNENAQAYAAAHLNHRDVYQRFVKLFYLLAKGGGATARSR